MKPFWVIQADREDTYNLDLSRSATPVVEPRKLDS